MKVRILSFQVNLWFFKIISDFEHNNLNFLINSVDLLLISYDWNIKVKYILTSEIRIIRMNCLSV